MKIRYSNLGPIENVFIDTKKKMTVIVGENGIGKTYLSILTYAFLRSLKFLFHTIIENSIEKILDESIKNKSKEIVFSIQDLIKKNSKSFLIDKKILLPFLEDIFSLGDDHKIFEDIEIEISNIDFVININKEKTYLSSFFMLTIKDKKVYITNINDEEFKLQDKKNIINMLIDIISDTINENCFFFTAERAAINIFSKELFIKRNELYDQILKHKLKGKSLKDIIDRGKRYTLPIQNSLNFANDIVEQTKKRGKYAFLAEKIEKDLLNGNLTVDSNSQIWFCHQSMKNKNVKLDMSASSIKTLASLVLCLRYKATKGMTIFIDEPELNLHPNMQVKLARILVMMINAELKVFISTHSDYIVRELNNMVIAYNVEDENFYNKDLYLKNEDLDVVRLYFNKKGIVLSEHLKIEKDGFTVESIDETIEKQNNINDELLEKLEEKIGI